MNNKNKVATVIASVIVGAAVVTGSVYAAVTASWDKEEPENSTVIATQEEAVSEASTEAISDITETSTVSKPTTTEQPSNIVISTSESTSTSASGMTQIPFKSQAELDAEYQEYLVWLKEQHDISLKSYNAGPPPKEPSSGATEREIELYNKRLKEYQERVARYDEYRHNEEIRYQQSLADAKIKYNQP